MGSRAVIILSTSCRDKKILYHSGGQKSLCDLLGTSKQLGTEERNCDQIRDREGFTRMIQKGRSFKRI